MITREEIENKVSVNGKGATRELLLSWGVLWPPPKGWKKKLLRIADEASAPPPQRLRDEAPKTRKTRGAAKNFYQTAAWKRARFAAFEHYGRRCMCCGWHPDMGGTNYLVVDHIASRRLRPDLELERSNLQVLCNECNLGKGSYSRTDFRAERQLGLTP